MLLNPSSGVGACFYVILTLTISHLLYLRVYVRLTIRAIYFYSQRYFRKLVVLLVRGVFLKSDDVNNRIFSLFKIVRVNFNRPHPKFKACHTISLTSIDNKFSRTSKKTF